MTIDFERRRLLLLAEVMRKKQSIPIEKFYKPLGIHRTTIHRLKREPHQMSVRVQRILEGVTK